MVLQVRPDAGKVGDDGNPERLQVLGVSDPGQLHQLGRVDGATTEDDLTGLDRALHAAGAHVLDAHRPLALEDHLGGVRKGLDVEVLPVHDRVQVGAGGAEPASLVDVAVEPGEPLLPIPVDVVGEGVAGLLCRLEEGTEERVGGRSALEHQRPTAATPLVRAGQARLHALEVRKAVGEVPVLHALVGAPALVVHGVAALEDHAVDAAGAAEHLAARMEDAAVVHVRLGVGLVAPVVEPAADREWERRGHVDERVPDEVGAPGFENQHRGTGIGAQPVGERRAG